MTQPNMYNIEMIQENNRDIREMRELREKREQNKKIETYFSNIAKAETEQEMMQAIEVQICSPYIKGSIDWLVFANYMVNAKKDINSEEYKDYKNAMAAMKQYNIPFATED
mgnify:CR=1 FL=1